MTQDGRGQAVVVEPAIAELAECDAQRVDDAGKAKQEVPPATRRLVVRRQRGNCAVPGCRNALFTDVHHIRLRSEGGTHEADKLVVMCAMHHRALHRGALIVEGTWSTGLTFRHADGSTYGAVANPRAAVVLSEVHQAVTGLGFKEREARWMVGEVCRHVGACGMMSTEDAIRRALRCWHERGRAGSAMVTAIAR
jgi:hypothetical protein